MKNLLVLTLCILSLAACRTTVKTDSPDVSVKGDGYEVQIDGDSNQKRDFCPPGQAKKGNC